MRRPRVTIILEGSKSRPDFVAQIFWMRQEGLSIMEIHRATGVCRQTISELIDMWQTQVEQTQAAGWKPHAVDRRRRNRRKWPETQP